jgi:hypothetical protein
MRSSGVIRADVPLVIVKASSFESEVFCVGGWSRQRPQRALSDIPIYRANRYEFIVNLKTAKARGLELAAILVGRAQGAAIRSVP